MRMIFLFFFLTVVKDMFSQGLLRIAPEVYDAYEKLDDAYNKMKSVESIVKEIDRGGRPNVSTFGESELKALTAFYRRSAQLIVQARMVTDFDSKPYSVSVDELNNCYLRNQNFSRLRQFQSALDQAVNLGQQELQKLNNFKTLIDSNFIALRLLIDLNARLSTIPIYREIFQWNWFELETGTSKALGYLETGVKAHTKKLQQEVDKVRAQSNNLRENTRQLESNLCNPSGTFRGACTLNNIFANYELVIGGNGTNFQGSLTTRNNAGTKVWVAPSIDISGEKIQFFGYWNGIKKLFVGRMTPNYASILEFRATDETGSCTLSKK